MNLCYKSCYIALIFFIASLYTTLRTDKEGLIKTLKETLTPQQLLHYEAIRSNRRSIYMKGLLYGLLIALLLSYINGKSILSTISISSNGCYIMSIMLVVSYLYYIITPKETIITKLHSSKQREAWYDVYRNMQVNYHIGIVLGIIGGGIYGYQLCK